MEPVRGDGSEVVEVRGHHGEHDVPVDVLVLVDRDVPEPHNPALPYGQCGIRVPIFWETRPKSTTAPILTVTP